MGIPEREAHGRTHRSLEFDLDSALSDEELGIDKDADTHPVFNDDFDSQTLKYVMIGGGVATLAAISAIALRNLHRNRKGL
jgi:hypothetical protein